MVEGSKNASLAAGSTSVIKGVVISDKCLWEETSDITPTKKGKETSDAKQKAASSKSVSKGRRLL